MTFHNSTILISELPKSEAVDFQQLDRLYAPICMIPIVAFVALLVVGLGAVVANPGTRGFLSTGFGTFALILGLTISIWLPLYNWFAAKVIGYALRQHDFILKSGLFWRNETVQPLSRVQHVELTRGPLDKRYGMANLKLFSAGSGRPTFVVPGLPLAEAERIRSYILDYHDQEEPETDDDEFTGN